MRSKLTFFKLTELDRLIVFAFKTDATSPESFVLFTVDEFSLQVLIAWKE